MRLSRHHDSLSNIFDDNHDDVYYSLLFPRKREFVLQIICMTGHDSTLRIIHDIPNILYVDKLSNYDGRACINTPGCKSTTHTFPGKFTMLSYQKKYE